MTYRLVDYTVAISIETGKAIASWRGKRFRKYDRTKVTQYKIDNAHTEYDARLQGEQWHSRYKQIAKTVDKIIF